MNKADKDRLEHIHTLPCVACEIFSVPSQPWPTEAHHLVDKGYRKHSGGHQATIPLCGWHHRGLCLDGHTGIQMQFHYGPSLALHKRDFTSTFGTERELLERVDGGSGER